MPAVSILLTSYNYAAYLGEAMTSILEQTWTDWELLVVDDGSSDGSVEILEGFVRADARIRLLRHPGGGNRGLAESLRLGLAQATAPLVAFLESDDAWQPQCLETRLRAFSWDTADVVFHNAAIVTMPGCDSTRLARYLRNLDRRFPRSGLVRVAGYLWLGNVLPSFSCVMARREALLQCDFAVPVGAWLDWWLWFQLAAKGRRFVYLADRLTRWRAHAGSYSATVTGAHGRRKRMLEAFARLSGVTAPWWVRSVSRLPAGAVSGLNFLVLRLLRLRGLGKG